MSSRFRVVGPRWVGLFPRRADVYSPHAPRQQMLARKVRKVDPLTKRIYGGIFLGVCFYVAEDEM